MAKKFKGSFYLVLLASMLPAFGIFSGCSKCEILPAAIEINCPQMSFMAGLFMQGAINFRDNDHNGPGWLYFAGPKANCKKVEPAYASINLPESPQVKTYDIGDGVSISFHTVDNNNNPVVFSTQLCKGKGSVVITEASPRSVKGRFSVSCMGTGIDSVTEDEVSKESIPCNLRPWSQHAACREEVRINIAKRNYCGDVSGSFQIGQ